MKNRDIFHKDPLSWQLLNEGVSSNNATDPATLRYELQTFVCVSPPILWTQDKVN